MTNAWQSVEEFQTVAQAIINWEQMFLALNHGPALEYTLQSEVQWVNLVKIPSICEVLPCIWILVKSQTWEQINTPGQQSTHLHLWPHSSNHHSCSILNPSNGMDHTSIASQKEKPIMQIDQCKVGKSKTRNDVCHRHSQFFFLAAVDTVTQAWYIWEISSLSNKIVLLLVHTAFHELYHRAYELLVWTSPLFH